MDWFWVGIYTDIPRVATPLTLRWHVHGVLYSHSRVRFLQYTVTKIVKSCQTYWKVAQIIDQTNVRFVLYVNKCVKMNRLLWTRTEWYVDRGRRIDVHDTLVSGWWCPLSVCLSVCPPIWDTCRKRQLVGAAAVTREFTPLNWQHPIQTYKRPHRGYIDARSKATTTNFVTNAFDIGDITLFIRLISTLPGLLCGKYYYAGLSQPLC